MFDFTEKDERIAIRDSDGAVTYAELARTTELLAGMLAGIHTGTTAGNGRISLILPRGRFHPIAAVATLRAGMAFNPIGSSNPDKRIAEILSEVQPCAVITTAEEYRKHKSVLGGPEVILIDRFRDTGQKPSDIPSDIPSDADAMIIFTSGSNGKPKGVIHTRGSLLANARYRLLSEEEKMRKIASVLDPAFLVSNIDMISCLLVHGEIHYPDRSVILDIKALSLYLSRNGITRLSATAQMASLMSRIDDPGVPLISFGGSRAGGMRKNRNTRFAIGYGSTESGFNTIRYFDDGRETANIGIPYNDVQIYLLDSQLNRVPEGESGEIYISSPRVARAYLGGGRLNADKFIPSPFSEGGTLCRTGDIGRRESDGSFTLLGRTDRMIKHNAYRIQPEEVEMTAENFDGVHSARLVDWHGALVLYYEGKCREPELLEHLRSSLPSYMIPSGIVRLERMPEKGYGKQDVESIVNAMKQVLNTDRVSPEDDFFRLGGDSLDILKLTFLLRERNLTAGEVFAGRTARGIASILPLVQFQRYVLETYMKYTCGTMWNTPFLYRIDGNHSLEEIIEAVKSVTDAHPILDFSYDTKAGVLRHNPTPEPRINVLDTESRNPGEFASSLIREFDINEAPLYRIFLLCSPVGTHLMLDFHHLISDGISIVAFVNQIGLALKGVAPLPDLYYEYARKHTCAGPVITDSNTGTQKLLSGVCKADISCGPNTSHTNSARKLTAICIAATQKALPHLEGGTMPEITWLSHNRTDPRYAFSFGPMLSRHAITVDTSLSDESMVEEITRKLEKPSGESSREFACNDTPTIEINNLCMIDSITGFSLVPMEIPGVQADPGCIAIILLPTEEGLRVRMEYNITKYGKEETESFFRAFISEFEQLLKRI